jgi:hypothetical protein
MRWYEIYTLEGAVLQIECDPIDFEDVLCSCYDEAETIPLSLCRDGKVIAVLKGWENLVDITEKQGVKNV